MSSRDPLLEQIRFVRELQRPMTGIGLIMPGKRGQSLRMLGRLESTLEQMQETQKSWERISQVAGVLVKNVQATNRIMAGIEQTTGQHLDRLGELDEGIQDRLREALSIQEEGQRLTRREDRVTERERHLDGMMTDVSQQLHNAAALEETVKTRLTEVISHAEQVQNLEAKICGQQAVITEGQSALRVRQEKMEQVKFHLQSREESVSRSLNQLGDLAQQKKDLQSELASLRVQCQEELERGDELLRERELTLAEREKEVGSMGMLLVERERALHERQQGVEKREVDLEKESKTLSRLRESLSIQERRVADLQATVETLNGQRDDLNRAIAGLSARL